MAATEEYLEAEDAIAAWLEDCCTIQAGFSVSKAAVRDSWAKRCQSTNQPIGGRNELTPLSHKCCSASQADTAAISACVLSCSSDGHARDMGGG